MNGTMLQDKGSHSYRYTRYSIVLNITGKMTTSTIIFLFSCPLRNGQKSKPICIIYRTYFELIC